MKLNSSLGNQFPFSLKTYINLLVSSFLFFCGCAKNQAPDPPSDNKSGKKKGGKKGMEKFTLPPDDLVIKIAFKGTQRRHNICLTATIKNNTRKTIGWDRKYSVFFFPTIIVNKEMHGLDPVCLVKYVKQSKTNLSKRRFFNIPPRKCVVRTIRLLTPALAMNPSRTPCI
jgi:hypothetical protein